MKIDIEGWFRKVFTETVMENPQLFIDLLIPRYIRKRKKYFKPSFKKRLKYYQDYKIRKIMNFAKSKSKT
jgi:hypothetical protein